MKSSMVILTVLVLISSLVFMIEGTGISAVEQALSRHNLRTHQTPLSTFVSPIETKQLSNIELPSSSLVFNVFQFDLFRRRNATNDLVPNQRNFTLTLSSNTTTINEFITIETHAAETKSEVGIWAFSTDPDAPASTKCSLSIDDSTTVVPIDAYMYGDNKSAVSFLFSEQLPLQINQFAYITCDNLWLNFTAALNTTVEVTAYMPHRVEDAITFIDPIDDDNDNDTLFETFFVPLRYHNPPQFNKRLFEIVLSDPIAFDSLTNTTLSFTAVNLSTNSTRRIFHTNDTVYPYDILGCEFRVDGADGSNSLPVFARIVNQDTTLQFVLDKDDLAIRSNSTTVLSCANVFIDVAYDSVGDDLSVVLEISPFAPAVHHDDVDADRGFDDADIMAMMAPVSMTTIKTQSSSSPFLLSSSSSEYPTQVTNLEVIDDKFDLFSVFHFDLVRRRNMMGELVPNYRNFTLTLSSNTTTINDSITITTWSNTTGIRSEASIWVIADPDAPASTKCSLSIDDSTTVVPIDAYMYGDNKSAVSFLFSERLPLQINQFAYITCENLWLDFNQALNTTVEVTAYMPHRVEDATTFIAPIDDDDQPPGPDPEPLEPFAQKFDVTLSQLPDALNIRHFALEIREIAYTFNSTLQFKFDTTPGTVLRSFHTDRESQCQFQRADENFILPAFWDSTTNDLYFDFAFDPLQIHDTITITCPHSHYFNFTDVINIETVVSLRDIAASQDLKLTAKLPKVNDELPPTSIKWPFHTATSSRSQYQSILPLTFTNLPHIAETNLGFSLDLAQTGAYCRTSNPTPALDHQSSITLITTDVTGHQSNTTILLNLDQDCRITGQQLNFPFPVSGSMHDSILFFIINYSTTHTDENFIISNFALTSLTSGLIYEFRLPDTTTAWKWDPKIAASPITMKYVNWVTKHDDRKFPTFELIFDRTITPLNSAITLQSNSTTSTASEQPAFARVHPDHGDKINSILTSSADCKIKQFGDVNIPVRPDAKFQSLTFDLTQVKQLQQPGHSFTLSCPEWAILAPARQHKDDTALSFSLHGVGTAQDGTQNRYSESWEMPTFDSYPTKKTGGFSTFFVVIVVLALIGVALYLLFQYVIKPSQFFKKYQENQRQRQEPLIGDDELGSHIN